MSKELLIEKAKALSVAATPGPWRRAAPIRPGMRSGVRSGSGYECFDSRDGDDQGSANMVFIAESRTLLPALADLAESEGKRADTNAKHCAEMTAARNRMDEARARACFERDAALSELARLKGLQP